MPQSHAGLRPIGAALLAGWAEVLDWLAASRDRSPGRDRQLDCHEEGDTLGLPSVARRCRGLVG